jgi:hypothetical protein
MRRLIVIVVLISVSLVGAAAQRVRHVEYGRPIAEVPQPGDSIVIVDREFDVAQSDEKPTPAVAIQDLTQRAAAVALVEVTDVSTELVEEGRWMRTRLTASVVEAVRSAGLTLAEGQRVSLTVGGGEMTVGGVLVRTSAFSRPLPLGRYLVFIFGAHLAAGPFLIEDGRVASIWREDLISKEGHPRLQRNADLPAALAGLEIDDLMRRIREVQ